MLLASLLNSVQSLYSKLVPQQGKACTSRVEACHVYCVVTNASGSCPLHNPEEMKTYI